MRVESLDVIKGLVGTELGVSDWITIEQDQISAFADVTGDHSSVHIDPEVGKSWGLGGTIAHGFLTLSLIAGLFDGIVPMPEGLTQSFNYGLDTVRFLAPVRCGKRVRARFRLQSFVETRPNHWRIQIEAIVEIEDEDKPALSAVWLILYVC